MHERIKKLRKALGLTQQEFADRLNIKRGTMANYEIGRNVPIDAVITLICREFNVNEKWLRTGEGEIHPPRTRDEEIASFLNDLRSGPDFRQKFISVLSRMTEDEWALLEKKVLELAREVQEDAQKKEDSVEALAQNAAQLTRDQGHSEKEPDTQASSVKESGAV